MSKTVTYFASESVCAGHPDKLCDQISDAILDEILKQDPNAKTGIEVMASADLLTLAGEIRTTAKVDLVETARKQIRRLDYTNADWSFHDGCEIRNFIHGQSPEIAVGVDAEGAGDQGMMFGFACNETPELMPLPIVLAHAITKGIDDARESGTLPYLRPDGKAQVVVKYENDKPVSVAHVTLAAPHNEDVSLEQVKEDLLAKIVMPALKKYGFTVDPQDVVANGTGVWHIPGPTSDAGLTGRKIVVDGYGGYARVGGGAFSGKDPSKVDRSGAYAARYVAKNIVAAGLATKCEVAFAYYIGGKTPVMTRIETFGTETKPLAEIHKFADDLLEPSVRQIVEKLDLKRPIYLQTAAYGHFGRNEFPWEKVVA
ncbi:MAG: methionine adenosyltransferase [Candidatus Saccharimonadales bacterium]